MMPSQLWAGGGEYAFQQPGEVKPNTNNSANQPTLGPPHINFPPW